ncbi:MerR family DNA-binding transcriptional regulator [Streptomyces purpureus]|uniref:MerR family DNA-binding transcriptional regulator n=1 Tax=Streptomyces purpureus TaxID=1951 RepID=UPI003CC7D6CD
MSTRARARRRRTRTTWLFPLNDCVGRTYQDAAWYYRAKTLRFYEQAGLLPAPPRTAGGYRDYPQQTARRLSFIRDAHPR